MKKPYKNQEWFVFRDRIIERDEDMCVSCGRSSADGAILQVHHKEYIGNKKPWDYPPDLCETLCKGCHAAEHGIIPPKTGWEFLFDEDFEEPSETCEYCGHELRYVYYIRHPNWPTVLGVGTVCCDNLTGTNIASEKRNYDERERRFLKSTRWKLSNNGQKISQGGIPFEVTHVVNGFVISINDFNGKMVFRTLDDAKKHVFRITENGDVQKFLRKNLESKLTQPHQKQKP